jgi:hypothetical protein
MTTMLTNRTVRDSIPRPREAPADEHTARSATRTVVTSLATATRFAGHFAVACVSVAVVGAATEH